MHVENMQSMQVFFFLVDVPHLFNMILLKHFLIAKTLNVHKTTSPTIHHGSSAVRAKERNYGILSLGGAVPPCLLQINCG